MICNLGLWRVLRSAVVGYGDDVEEEECGCLSGEWAISGIPPIDELHLGLQCSLSGAGIRYFWGFTPRSCYSIMADSRCLEECRTGRILGK